MHKLALSIFYYRESERENKPLNCGCVIFVHNNPNIFQQYTCNNNYKHIKGKVNVKVLLWNIITDTYRTIYLLITKQVINSSLTRHSCTYSSHTGVCHIHPDGVRHHLLILRPGDTVKSHETERWHHLRSNDQSNGG